MSVLVLGGSGYLGRAVCLELEGAGLDVVALSRSGSAAAGRGLRGDVTRHNLGLFGDELAELQAEVTHVVGVFGSVDWDSGPAQALDVHATGVRNVLRFSRACPKLEALVHVSSLLAFGRAEGRVGNRELYVGQDFRNWYEYGKYHAEALVREAEDLPFTVLRFGPLLGPDPAGHALGAGDGLLAAVPYLLQGYPVHLKHGGRFPSYVGDVVGAAEVVAAAVRTPATGATWTWFDPALPTVAEVMHRLCRPWGVVPKIVDSAVVGRVQRLVASRIGLPKALLDYAEPWFDLDPSVMDTLPGGPPACRPGYLAGTGRALLEPEADLQGSFT
ncbi:SDR family oxidoreductase [Actinocorallia sp. B10E7]|uniref:SDR family oxidoreductase n=1 Tax=Actinocorallia sp. B10E7 TaxID=3153558 RepID=UPI00325F4F02